MNYTPIPFDDKRWYWVGGVDPAQGGHGRTATGGKLRFQGDDFSLCTGRFKWDGPVEVVDVVRESNLTHGQMSAIIHRKDEKFRYDLLVMDPNGGGTSVRDELREPIQDTGTEKFTVKPLITIDDDQLAGAGDPRLCFFGRSDSRIVGDDKRQIPGLGLELTSESTLPNKMHELFAAALQCRPQKVRFPQYSPKLKNNPFNHADDMRRFLNSSEIDGIEKSNAEIDLALRQLIQVERETTDEGKPKLDKTGNFTFKSTQKKDAAYAMIYMYFASFMIKYELNLQIRKPKKKSQAYIGVDNA